MAGFVKKEKKNKQEESSQSFSLNDKLQGIKIKWKPIRIFF